MQTLWAFSKLYICLLLWSHCLYFMCRDRAQERRKGFNPDYERVAADLAGLVGATATTDLNTISVEDSKYLGGDVDHTHLVKGLDYALLQKVEPLTACEKSPRTAML